MRVAAGHPCPFVAVQVVVQIVAERNTCSAKIMCACSTGTYATYEGYASREAVLNTV